MNARILSGPAWLTAQPAELKLMGLPKPENVGDTLIRVEISDGKGGFDTQEFPVEILPAATTSRTSYVLPVDSQVVTLELPPKPMTFIWENPASSQGLLKSAALARVTGFTFSLSGENLDTTVTSIADTSVTLNIMSKLQPKAAYSWSVQAVGDSNAVINVSTYSFNTTEIKKSLSKISSRIPRTYELEQNYPNPFNSATAIEFGVPELSKVSLIVCNMLGQEVGRVFEDRVEPGYHRFYWESRGLPSGVYFLRMQARAR